jgi:hypothetical protein
VCHQIEEVRAAIQHYDLAIQDRPLPFQTAKHLLKKRFKLTELLPLARHQPGLLAIDIQDPAKAVVLQLVDPSWDDRSVPSRTLKEMAKSAAAL